MTAAAPTDYRKFLEAKIRLAETNGFAVDPAEINPALKPHIQIAVQWGLAGGRRALFSRFGTQKTTWHIEMMRLTARRVKDPALITLPLGARMSFWKDAGQYFTGEHAVKLNFIREDSEIDRGAINITNVERVREGKIDPRRFGCTTWDEGDMLRNMSTKTFWTYTERAKQVEYRHVATATPDPRDYAELLAFAGYLDIMDVGQARTRFFKRNSERADELTLHDHKAREFWAWVASWSLWYQRPSDIDATLSDDGYDLPPLDVQWHEVPTDHSTAGEEKNGQRRLLKDAAAGVQGAANEKRRSIPARVAKMMELRAECPAAHRIIWHDLEDERRAIEKAAPEVVTVYGNQDPDEREEQLVDFAEGRVAELGGKPVMIGSGPNFQFHCWWEIFLGVTFKFKEFIQAVHRLQRYGQAFEGLPADWPKAVRLDIIHSEAEREVVRKLKHNWRRYDEQAARMAAMIREYGLTQLALATTLTRTMGVERSEHRGDRFACIRNDCVEETRRMDSSSIDCIVTSLPFSTQYEYTPSYNDFGHTDDDPHFFRQMDFLTPELLRVLKPGRIAAIHCKDRVVEGSRSGLGFQTIAPFGDRVKEHFIRHGFAYLGTKYIDTDVVRENNATYRLGWSEQCKDGTRMGFGLVEYLHVFRKPQTDRSRGYADLPVVKGKRSFDKISAEWICTADDPLACDPRGYSRARWQLDAAGVDRTSGDRLLTPQELASLDLKGGAVIRAWRAHCLTAPYDFEHHVACGEALDQVGKLRPDFAVVPVHSRHPDIWTDVVRMRSLNTVQALRGKEKHLCPLPFDIVDRVIARCTMKDELVYDPFMGIGTVPYCAILQGRHGIGTELNGDYWRSAFQNCAAAEQKVSVPSLFDLLAAPEIEAEMPAEAAE